MRKSLHLILVAVAALVAALTLTATALATNPHFINASASGPANNGNLTVSWKEAGLGNNQLIAYVASADATGPCLHHRRRQAPRRRPTRRPSPGQ